jgi:hypothetical protein
MSGSFKARIIARDIRFIAENDADINNIENGSWFEDCILESSATKTDLLSGFEFTTWDQAEFTLSKSVVANDAGKPVIKFGNGGGNNYTLYLFNGSDIQFDTIELLATDTLTIRHDDSSTIDSSQANIAGTLILSPINPVTARAPVDFHYPIIPALQVSSPPEFETLEEIYQHIRDRQLLNVRIHSLGTAGTSENTLLPVFVNSNMVKIEFIGVISFSSIQFNFTAATDQTLADNVVVNLTGVDLKISRSEMFLNVQSSRWQDSTIVGNYFDSEVNAPFIFSTNNMKLIISNTLILSGGALNPIIELTTSALFIYLSNGSSIGDDCLRNGVGNNIVVYVDSTSSISAIQSEVLGTLSIIPV